MTPLYLIYSRKHTSNGVVCWWLKNGMGYTEDLADAGVYTAEEAQKVAVGSRDSFIVPLAEVCKISRVTTMDQNHVEALCLRLQEDANP